MVYYVNLGAPVGEIAKLVYNSNFTWVMVDVSNYLVGANLSFTTFNRKDARSMEDSSDLSRSPRPSIWGRSRNPPYGKSLGKVYGIRNSMFWMDCEFKKYNLDGNTQFSQGRVLNQTFMSWFSRWLPKDNRKESRNFAQWPMLSEFSHHSHTFFSICGIKSLAISLLASERVHQPYFEQMLKELPFPYVYLCIYTYTCIYIYIHIHRWSTSDCETLQTDCETSRADCATWIVKLDSRIVKLPERIVQLGLWNLKSGLWNYKARLWNSEIGLWNCKTRIVKLWSRILKL